MTARTRLRRFAVAVPLVAALVGTSSVAAAAPPEPSGPHPRLWLDAKTKNAIKAAASKNGSHIGRAIRECRRAAAALSTEARNEYMGFNWASNTSNCALAWHATGDAAHAKTGIHFFTALLDDWGAVGDGKGGDTAVRHDSGYAIRAVGVHTAIGYDLLHDAPGMTPALLAKARQRFAAWIDWYEKDGYRARSPGTNYHAGYLFAVTAIAIAQGSEAGPAGAKLWRHVVDDVWGQMRKAAQPGGLLEGGDWAEGWQYGPLSVASYGLASRAMIEQGVPLPEFTRWADDIVMRHVHALTPGDKGIFVAGDTQVETPSITPNAWTLTGVIAGPASDKAASWARAELDRLKLKTEDKSFLVYDVLAEARGVPAVPFPRDSAPTSYLAKGTGAFYARTSWSPSAVWTAMLCTKTLDVDHLPANAGNFVLSRGGDELVVDPSPYGTLSSMTSNAPTVESGHLPPDYKPSQAFWSEKTRWVWARQTESAAVVARCDYADQYKFQERPSDVPFAVRDFVLLPSNEANATLVVVDRARSGADTRGLHLRFRSAVPLSPPGKDGVSEGANGRSSLVVTPLHTSAVAMPASVRETPRGNCFGAGTKRGDCTAARFPVHDYSVVLRGAQALAIHALDVGAAGPRAPAPKTWGAADHRVFAFERGKSRSSVIVAEPAVASSDKLIYRAEPGRHVVLDAPASATGRVAAAAEKDGNTCKVTLRPTREGGMDARPLAMTVSDTCEVKEDPISTKVAALASAGPSPAAPAGGDPGATSGNGAVSDGRPRTGAEVFVPPPANTAPRVGNGTGPCGCRAAGARGSETSAVAAALVALVALVRRRARRD